MARSHTFHAVAFVENFALKDLAAGFRSAKLSLHDLQVPLPDGSHMYLYPFGTVVFHGASAERRSEELANLHRVRPGLTTQVVREEFRVDEGEAKSDVADGVLHIDRLTPERASVVALTVAQSAAMEYYETLVDRLFARTEQLVTKLERRGTVPLRVRPLHRFVGEAIGARSEVLTVLHLLDKPDAAWDDPAMDHIYVELRAEFDLVDRYQALESKLGGIQEALELLIDVARDRRTWMLELSIIALFVFEIALTLSGHR